MISTYKPDFKNTPVSLARSVRIPQILQRDLDLIKLNPVLSIITPYYNTGEIFLESALSLRRQTLQNFEWIILDDASNLSEENLRVLDTVLELVPQARLARSEINNGLPATRNRAVEFAKSKFIFLFDSDDLIEPTTLEKCLWYLNTHPTDVIVSGYEVGFGANQYLNTRGFSNRELLREENLKNPTSLIRKEVYHEVGGFDSSNREGLEDWDFWLKVADHGYWGGTVPEFLNWYRWSGGQNRKWKNLSSVEAIEAFRQKLITKYQRAFSEPFSSSTRKFSFQNVKNPLNVAVDYSIQICSDNSPLNVNAETSVLFLSEPDAKLEASIYKITSDVFVLPRFLTPDYFEVFIEYFKASRKFRG